MSMLRLAELVKLQDGWDGPKSHKLSGAALITAGNLTPVPVADGSIVIEMHAGGIDLEIDIAPDGKVRSVYVRPTNGESIMWEAESS